MVQAQGANAWRELCRQEAAFQAKREAQIAWQIEDGADAPFNYRWEHVQRVVQLALWLAVETDADPEAAEAAAWLHDIRKGEPDHGQAGAVAAAAVLAHSDFPAAKAPLVVEAIRQHAGLFRPEGAPPLEPLEAAVLWDADKLSKLGLEAVAYSLSAPFVQGRTLAERRRDIAEYTQTVLSRSVTSMNTAPARRLAERRFADMISALELWAQDERFGEA
jgi:uncharacterized protein